MQITESIVAQISRKTFNQMFDPALRRSKVLMSGNGSSVSWADNAGHANSADTATTADSATTAASASAAPWAGITDKPATATRWPAWSEVTDKPSTFAPSSGSSYYMTRDAWWTNGETHDANDLRSGVVFAYSTQTNVPVTGTLVAFSCRTNNNYALQLQGAYNLDTLYFRNRNGDNNTWKDWHYVIHDGNIGNQSVNYATSAGSATKATQDGDGNTISSTYLKLIGGTLTGNLTVNPANTNDARIGVTNTNASGTSIYLLASTNRGVYHSTAGWLVATNGTDSWLNIGKVGIGTDSPSQKLHVSGGLLAITNNSRTVTIGAQNSGGVHIYNDNNCGFYFNGSICANSSAAYDLGSTSYPWRRIYFHEGSFVTAKSTYLDLVTNGNEMCIGAGSSNDMYINYRASNGTKTVNNFIWKGGSSSTWASHQMGNLSVNGKVEVYDTTPSVHVGTSSSARISLHWASDSNRGLYDYTGNWVVATNSTNTFMMKGNVGIGTTSPSYKLHVSGQIYCTGGFTFLSDERKKNIIDYDVKLSVDDIANAPLIHYTLKDDPEKRVRVGSIAQYWNRVLPESVNHAEDGTLSMNYDLQAHASVIVLARKVRELERIIYNLQSTIA